MIHKWQLYTEFSMNNGLNPLSNHLEATLNVDHNQWTTSNNYQDLWYPAIRFDFIATWLSMATFRWTAAEICLFKITFSKIIGTSGMTKNTQISLNSIGNISSGFAISLEWLEWRWLCNVFNESFTMERTISAKVTFRILSRFFKKSIKIILVF